MTGDLNRRQRTALAELVNAAGYPAAAAIIREDVRGFITVNDATSARSGDDLADELVAAARDFDRIGATRGKGGVILVGQLGRLA